MLLMKSSVYVTYCLGVCECAGCKESFAFECEYEFVSLCNMLINCSGISVLCCLLECLGGSVCSWVRWFC